MAVYALGADEPDIHPDAYVHPDATVIGRVRLGAEATVWPGAVLRGDDGAIEIGARTSVQDGCVIHATATLDTIVGERCVIGHLAHLEGCTVRDDALVGSNSVVLHDAVVESHALVGASALVPGGMVVPTGAMALGVPATLREGRVGPGDFDDNVAVYTARGHRYREELRRIE